MDIFLKRVTLPQEKPQAGPQQETEEGLAIIGDDSSMWLLLLLTLQWDKVWGGRQ
jgi:hypothetical protein